MGPVDSAGTTSSAVPERLFRRRAAAGLAWRASAVSWVCTREESRRRRSTNLWDGLLKGMQQVKKGNVANTLSSVFLLTDGVPNVEPPRGHIPMMQKFIDENPHLKFSVNVFGFGYNLMSSLLLEIALNGGGNYSFIPDASFVGTVFVHSVSNELCKVSRNGQARRLSTKRNFVTT
jgi:hypothetical protein